MKFVLKALVANSLLLMICASGAQAKQEYPSLNIEAELRMRAEFSDNFDFNRELSDDKYPFLTRFRVDLDWHITPRYHFIIQPQASFRGLWSGDEPAHSDHTILYQAYFEARDPVKWAWEWRVGRQEIEIEDGTLVGASYWHNVGQSFDGVRFRRRSPTFELDLFAAKVAEWRGSGEEDLYLAGVASATHPYSPHKFFGHVLYKRDRRTGVPEVDQYTVGGGYHFKPGTGFDIVLGADYQFGDFGTSDISAYRYFAKVSRATRKPKPLRLGAEFYYHSGDTDPADDNYKVFSPPFPDDYRTRGLANIIGAGNTSSLEFFVESKPARGLSIEPSFHLFWVNSTSGTGPDGQVAYQLAPGGSQSVSRYLGHEFDFEIRYQPAPNYSVKLGWAHFEPKGFFRDVLGTNDPTDFVYLELTYLFR